MNYGISIALRICLSTLCRKLQRHAAMINYAAPGFNDVADLLNQTLEEEKAADSKLNDIAINYVNATMSH